MNDTPANTDYEVRRREGSRLGRRTRDRECLREMRAILERVYGKSAVATFKDRAS